MEGVGSRLGRASSRYGPAPVFTGPVRKWKKQWVQVSSSLSHSRSSHANNNSNNAPPLLLCRWTPVSSTHSGDSSVNPDEPPRRKIRYTPIVVLDEKKKDTKNDNDGPVASKTYQSRSRETIKSGDIFRKQDIDSLFVEESQATNREHLTPDNSNNRLGNKDDDDHDNSDDETKEGEIGGGRSDELWH